MKELRRKADDIVCTTASPCGTPLVLKRMHGSPNSSEAGDKNSPFHAFLKKKHRKARAPADRTSDDELNLVKALRHKPWISYYESETSSDDSDVELMDAAGGRLPTGVLRGCPSCDNCQKVLARWQPEAGCRPCLDEAPVFFPLEEEFRDTMQYLASITAEAEQYGICRIVPPKSWQPSCPLREFDKGRSQKLPTRVQQIHKLQVRESQDKSHSRRKKRCRGGPSQMVDPIKRGPLSDDYPEARSQSSDDDDNFGFDSGPDFTLDTFEKYANQFKEEYFRILDASQSGGPEILHNDSKRGWDPSVENIEGEYWRIVEHPTEEIEVLYGADIETAKFGSGFPLVKPGAKPTSYEKSGWNLNNIARLPGSLLTFEEADVSGVVVPWLYVGMCFSSFCWHVEDHHLYSLNYMHWGAPKVWYGVPSSAALKLEDAMKKHLPKLFEKQPDLLHKLVTQLSPSILKAEGVPVYRAVQNPGEFVITFPRAYHAGFNCGFNCAEAVNLAPVDWLAHGQNAVELYRQQRRKTSVSHDKILLGAARQALMILEGLKEGKESEINLSPWQKIFYHKGILAKALKKRVEMEHVRRAGISNLVHTRRMEHLFNATDDKECFICYYDLHLSAVGCECSPKQFACLEHAELLCACGKAKKVMLYRDSLSELDSIVTTLEEQSVYLNRLLQEENLFYIELSPFSESHYVDKHTKTMLSTLIGNRNQKALPDYSWDQFVSWPQPSADIAEYRIREDVLGSLLTNGGIAHENQRPRPQRLLDTKESLKSQPVNERFSGDHLRLNKPGLSGDVAGGRVSDIILRNTSDGSTMEVLLSSSRKSNVSLLHTVEDSSKVVFESHVPSKSKQMLRQGTEGATQRFCSSLRSFHEEDGKNNSMIVQSEDNNNDAGSDEASSLGWDIDAGGVVFESFNSKKPSTNRQSDVNAMGIRMHRHHNLIDPFEGRRTNLVDNASQGGTIWNLDVAEPLPGQMNDRGNGEEICDRPYKQHWTQPVRYSFALEKLNNSQQMWRASTDPAPYRPCLVKY